MLITATHRVVEMEKITSDRKITCPKCGAENLSWRSRCGKCGEDLHKNERPIPNFEGEEVDWTDWPDWVAGLILGSAGLAVIFLAIPVLVLWLCLKLLMVGRDKYYAIGSLAGVIVGGSLGAILSLFIGWFVTDIVIGVIVGGLIGIWIGDRIKKRVLKKESESH